MGTPITSPESLTGISKLVDASLLPLATSIDRDGLYPRDFLRQLGALGGFGRVASPSAALEPGLSRQIDIIARVGSVCGSTAFLVWCQSTCAWYLQHAPEAAVRQRYLEPVARGTLLAGTGMSNAVKHLAGIEKMHLVARRSGDGYVVDGVLPWVSNLDAGHLLVAAASVEGGGYVMFAVECGTAGPTLHHCPEFSGMRGTGTLNVRFRAVHIDAGGVLAHPEQFDEYMRRIKAGFVLGQTGMGFGVVEGSLKTIREGQASHAHVNAFLDDSEAGLAEALATLQARALVLAGQVQSATAPMLPVLKLRAEVSGLALRAANAAVLHAGARGYLMRHPAQRQLREAVFVAIVTPALKHLRKEIHDLEQASARTEAA